jgi:hypothetical protein
VQRAVVQRSALAKSAALPVVPAARVRAQLRAAVPARRPVPLPEPSRAAASELVLRAAAQSARSPMEAARAHRSERRPSKDSALAFAQSSKPTSRRAQQTT